MREKGRDQPAVVVAGCIGFIPNLLGIIIVSHGLRLNGSMFSKAYYS
jgi:hypothetical protein